MQEVLPNIFFIDDQEIENYDSYKKRYDKLSKLNYKINNKKTEKVIGKRDYDKNPKEYNDELIIEIIEVNSKLLTANWLIWFVL